MSTATNEAAAPKLTLAEARAKMVAREAAEQAERDAAELEGFNLLERFEGETNGREGVDFAVVDLTDVKEGFVVVKLGEAALFKAFANSKMSEVDVDAFVLPNVLHPSKDEFRRITSRRPFCGVRCASALSALYGVRAKGEEGK
jgi:hypothetical protein